jgi:hypothetical protein
MSIVDVNQQCPLCGESIGVIENGVTILGNTIANCRTEEKQFGCGNPTCGFAWWTKITQFNGRQFWSETTHYPMDADGKVLRPTTAAK